MRTRLRPVLRSSGAAATEGEQGFHLRQGYGGHDGGQGAGMAARDSWPRSLSQRLVKFEAGPFHGPTRMANGGGHGALTPLKRLTI